MKKIISFVLALLIAVSTAVCASAFQIKESGLEVTNDWDNNLEVTAYSGIDPVAAIPESVLGKNILRIGESAMYGNTVIETLIMNDLMTNIKEWALRNCPNLKKVYYSKELIVIDRYAFAYNPMLRTALLRNTKLNALNAGVYANSAVEYVSLPDTLESIENVVFENTKVRLVNIPSSAVKIGNRCFADCAGLKAVYIPDSVTEIGEDAFLRCPDVTVYTSESSTAQSYCAENSVKCVIIDKSKFPSRLIGDVNGDNELDINDVTFIQSELAGYKTEFLSDNCDYNGDCVLNIDDATEIQITLAKLK